MPVEGCDHAKLDAALSAALDEVEEPETRTLDVFVHTTASPDDTQLRRLGELGVDAAGRGRSVFVAKTSARAVAELTREPWVRYVRLSRPMRLA